MSATNLWLSSWSLSKGAWSRAVILDRYGERITRSLRSFVSLFQRRDIQLHTRQVVKKNFDRRAALKFGKTFNVTEAAPARIDKRIGAAFLGDKREKLFMISHTAIGAKQTVSRPLSATAAAAQTAAALHPTHFGKRRPGAADRAIAFHPAFRYRRCPTAIASLQEGNR